MKKLFVGVLWVALSLSVQGKEVNMTSPDGKYQFTLSDSGGQLHYSLTWNGKQTVKPSLRREADAANRDGNQLPLSYAYGWAISADYEHIFGNRTFTAADNDIRGNADAAQLFNAVLGRLGFELT